MDIWNLFSPTITNIVLVIALVCIISNQRHIRRLEAQLEALNHEQVSESEKSLSGPIVEDGIDEENVAVIAAAVVACGYVPLAVRKARRHKRRHTRWVMAGRLAGMR